MLFHLGDRSTSCPDRVARSRSPSGWPTVRPPIRATMIAYLERKRATCQPKTVSAIATRLTHFGVFLADADPGLDSIAALDRRRHIEPYLTSLVDAVERQDR